MVVRLKGRGVLLLGVRVLETGVGGGLWVEARVMTSLMARM